MVPDAGSCDAHRMPDLTRRNVGMPAEVLKDLLPNRWCWHAAILPRYANYANIYWHNFIDTLVPGVTIAELRQ